jgi:hypothetical protein
MQQFHRRRTPCESQNVNDVFWVDMLDQGADFAAPWSRQPSDQAPI